MSDTPCAAWTESGGSRVQLATFCCAVSNRDQQGSREGLGGDQRGEGVRAYVMALKNRVERTVHNVYDGDMVFFGE